METTKPHAVLLASPGMGHITPIAELAKHMVANHGFQVTLYVITNDASLSQTQLINNLNITQKLFQIVILPHVNITALINPSTHIFIQLLIMMHQALPSLRRAILELEIRPIALVVDFFGTEALSMAEEFNMLKYVFIASNAWFLALTIHIPTLDRISVEEEHVKKRRPLVVPGCKAIRVEDTLDLLLDPNGQMYDEYVRIGVEIMMADGILVNTWEDLEPKALSALGCGSNKVPLYPVGPLVRPVDDRPRSSNVLDWLGMQPKRSVIYVSFGSGGTISAKQTIELAWGLELSKHRFIWVVRPPIDTDSSAAVLNTSVMNDGTLDFLPEGFITRTQETGIVVPLWAPQTEILSHESIGGFVTHCGWNSTLESIVNGVPMVAWPLYAEQRMNAAMLIEEVGVALGLEVIPTEQVVGRSEIQNVVQELMEVKGNGGRRDRVETLKASGEKALREGGSSFNSLSHIAEDCNIRLIKTLNKG
ncbi:UDP-Glycosyltransferase superfamily protein [Euphorbia peplus]|nr:UDP-Glycosyltransferase superfamily protein [Euphorbia peplus]